MRKPEREQDRIAIAESRRPLSYRFWHCTRKLGIRESGSMLSPLPRGFPLKRLLRSEDGDEASLRAPAATVIRAKAMSALRSASFVGIILFGVGAAVQAHHSTTVFDSSRMVTVTGRVAKFEWTNPHVFVWVDVPRVNDPGRQDPYAFETASPSVLESAGWNRTVLKAGDTITIDYAPHRDGRNGGLWILGRLADGRVLSGRGGPVSSGRPPPQGAARAASARCPRAEVVEVMPKASAQTRPVAYRNGTIHVSRAPLATLADVVKVDFDASRAIVLTFRPEVGERMERITTQPGFPMAFVVDDDAVLSVVLEGGFGIGKNGLQISLDSDEERLKEISDSLSRCVRSPITR